MVLRRFLGIVVRPFGAISTAWDVVQIIGSVIGLASATTAPSIGVGFWPLGLLAGLGALCLLFGWAGYRLQAELEHRNRVDFDCTAYMRPRTDAGRYLFRVSVVNNGPTSEFAAQIINVRGVPEEWHKEDTRGYRVFSPAWERTSEKRVQIPRRHEERIEIAQYSALPLGARQFHFWTTQKGSQQAGWVDTIRLNEHREYQFDLVIANVGDRDQEGTWAARISIVPDGGDPRFTLTRVQSIPDKAGWKKR